MHLRRTRIVEEDTVDISERLRQIVRMESTALLDHTLAHEGITHPHPPRVKVPVQLHEGQFYVAAAHGEPHFKTVTLLHRTRDLPA